MLSTLWSYIPSWSTTSNFYTIATNPSITEGNNTSANEGGSDPTQKLPLFINIDNNNEKEAKSDSQTSTQPGETSPKNLTLSISQIQTEGKKSENSQQNMSSLVSADYSSEEIEGKTSPRSDLLGSNNGKEDRPVSHTNNTKANTVNVEKDLNENSSDSESEQPGGDKSNKLGKNNANTSQSKKESAKEKIGITVNNFVKESDRLKPSEVTELLCLPVSIEQVSGTVDSIHDAATKLKNECCKNSMDPAFAFASEIGEILFTASATNANSFTQSLSLVSRGWNLVKSAVDKIPYKKDLTFLYQLYDKKDGLIKILQDNFITSFANIGMVDALLQLIKENYKYIRATKSGSGVSMLNTLKSMLKLNGSPEAAFDWVLIILAMVGTRLEYTKHYTKNNYNRKKSLFALKEIFMQIFLYENYYIKIKELEIDYKKSVSDIINSDRLDVKNIVFSWIKEFIVKIPPYFMDCKINGEDLNKKEALVKIISDFLNLLSGQGVSTSRDLLKEFSEFGKLITDDPVELTVIDQRIKEFGFNLPEQVTEIKISNDPQSDFSMVDMEKDENNKPTSAESLDSTTNTASVNAALAAQETQQKEEKKPEQNPVLTSEPKIIEVIYTENENKQESVATTSTLSVSNTSDIAKTLNSGNPTTIPQPQLQIFQNDKSAKIPDKIADNDYYPLVGLGLLAIMVSFLAASALLVGFSWLFFGLALGALVFGAALTAIGGILSNKANIYFSDTKDMYSTCKSAFPRGVVKTVTRNLHCEPLGNDLFPKSTC